MTPTCPKHPGRPLNVWPSGDLYCSAKDPSGPKGYCTTIIKVKDLPPAAETPARVIPSGPPGGDSFVAGLNPTHRVALACAALAFASEVFRGGGEDARGPALALADATYHAWIKVCS